MENAKKYRPQPDELRKHASLFWPAELREQEAAASIIPLLIKTQDKFISILDVSDKSPDAWKDALKATSELPANLFLKHLMVLADVGGEHLKRLRPELEKIFS
ncbi:MAG: restriction endonuclease, partial [Limisphaerales bacterium]